MKKTYLLLAVLAVVIFYLFNRRSSSPTNALALPLPLAPTGGGILQPLTGLPSQTPAYVPQGPVQGGGWIGSPATPAPDANVILDYQAPDLGAGFYSDNSALFV